MVATFRQENQKGKENTYFANYVYERKRIMLLYRQYIIYSRVVIISKFYHIMSITSFSAGKEEKKRTILYSIYIIYISSYSIIGTPEAIAASLLVIVIILSIYSITQIWSKVKIVFAGKIKEKENQ